MEYPDSPVLTDLSLEVDAGETLALLGPSGSGKTTLMYAIAGFVEPSAGEIEISGKVVHGRGKSVPPERRNIGLVFQNYALWPHLNVLETVAYPLRRSGKGKEESFDEAARLLELAGIAGLSSRMPSELSGGQQQRVGLARALARNAGLYLFDEPTAHLDAYLRTSLQDEILRRRQESGAAAVYSTHDSAEALSIADRVAILREGSILQVGTPKEVYERPADEWSARLTGSVATVTVEVLSAGGGRAEVSLGELTLMADTDMAGPAKHARMLVRPEWVTSGGPIQGVVVGVRYRGPHTDYTFTSAFGPLDIRSPGPPNLAVGDRSGLSIERGWIPKAEILN